MYDIDTYLITKNNAGGPIYVEPNDPELYHDRKIYDDKGHETVGSKTGRLLSYLIIASFIIYLWAR